jgi:DNA-binding transcriptional ArsR family regulator
MADASGRVATITSPSQIEALSNPVRIRILRHADTPITVAELADRLGVPKTRLYYHVNLLVEADMLVQVDERKSGARTEKIYRRTAADFQLGSGLAAAFGDRRKAAEAAASVLFDPARVEAEDHLEHVLGGGKTPGRLGRSVARLSPEAAERFARRVEDLLSDFRDLDLESDGESRTFSLTAALVPVDAPEATS